MMNVVGADLLLDALSSISSLGSHKHRVTKGKRLGESHRTSPLGSPETLTEPSITQCPGRDSGRVVPHPALPVTLVESDAWGRRVSGTRGASISPEMMFVMLWGVDAGQTNHTILLPRGAIILPKEEEGHRAKNSVVDI